MPMSAEEVTELLQAPLLAHLAVVRSSGRPHVTPIWVVYDKGAFYFTTRWRRVKGRVLRERPYAALSVATDQRPYRAVIAEGDVEEVHIDREAWLRRIATKYGRAEGERWLAYSLKEPDRIVLRLRPSRALSWHYGRGDYRRQNEGVSMSTSLQ